MHVWKFLIAMTIGGRAITDRKISCGHVLLCRGPIPKRFAPYRLAFIHLRAIRSQQQFAYFTAAIAPCTKFHRDHLVRIDVRAKLNCEGKPVGTTGPMSPFTIVCSHYTDVIMGTIPLQITSLTIVYSTVYSDADQRKYQSSASLALVRASNTKYVSIWWRHHSHNSNLMELSFCSYLNSKWNNRYEFFKWHARCAGLGVTKPIFSVPLFSTFSVIAKTNVSYWISRSYLAGVAAAQLRWHLSNMHVNRGI